MRVIDPLTDLLDHVRSRGALLGRNLVDPPWSVRCDDGAEVALVAMLRGSGWVHLDESEPVLVERGDVALVIGQRGFTVSDSPQAPPRGFVLDDLGECTDAAGAAVGQEDYCLGARTCGQRLDAAHAVLTGSFSTTSPMAERLLSALPRVLVVPSAQRQRAPLALLEEELERDDPGQQAVLDRLLELVLAGTLRDWFALPGVRAPQWYAGAGDPVVGPALRAIQSAPDRAWTLALLAEEASVSRATLARRFAEIMGEPPIAYLTGWRLCLGADLLRRTEATVQTIARRVGYADGYAFSAAFLRQYGMRPSEHRARGLDIAPVR